MALIAVANGVSLNADTFNLSPLLDGIGYAETSRLFAANFGGGDAYVLTGAGFKYDAEGYPIAGVVTSVGTYFGGVLSAVYDGISVKAVDILNAALTFGRADDVKLETTALAGNDTEHGANQADLIRGFNGNDTLTGAAGNDSLYGGAGNDLLIGGAGKDRLQGDAGADHFRFDGVADTSGDTIVDFRHTQLDKIDVHNIDANGAFGAGNSAFTWIGAGAFTVARIGELQVKHTTGDAYVVSLDTDKDNAAEASFTVHSDHPLVAGDFIL